MTWFCLVFLSYKHHAKLWQIEPNENLIFEQICFNIQALWINLSGRELRLTTGARAAGACSLHCAWWCMLGNEPVAYTVPAWWCWVIAGVIAVSIVSRRPTLSCGPLYPLSTHSTHCILFCVYHSYHLPRQPFYNPVVTALSLCMEADYLVPYGTLIYLIHCTILFY